MDQLPQTYKSTPTLQECNWPIIAAYIWAFLTMPIVAYSLWPTTPAIATVALILLIAECLRLYPKWSGHCPNPNCENKCYVSQGTVKFRCPACTNEITCQSNGYWKTTSNHPAKQRTDRIWQKIEHHPALFFMLSLPILYSWALSIRSY